MLYISTSKIHESTVGASFTVSFTVAPDEIGYLTALHEKYAEMNMSEFTIKPNSSEKPNNCTDCECIDDCTECKEAEHGCKDEPTISKMEQVDKDINVRSKPNDCKYAVNPSGDVWECGCCLEIFCEHQIYDRNPDGTLNIVKCGFKPKTEPQTDDLIKQADDLIEFEKELLKTEPQKDCFLCKWLGEVDVCGRCRNRNLFCEAELQPRCPKCGKRGYIRSLESMGVKLKHFDEYKWKCTNCNKYFKEEPKDEPQTERSACDTCQWYNSGIPCGVEPSVCKRAVEYEPQTEREDK